MKKKITLDIITEGIYRLKTYKNYSNFSKYFTILEKLEFKYLGNNILQIYVKFNYSN